MSAFELSAPFPAFTDRSGDPLDGGYVYFGEANKDPRAYPVNVFYDQALAIPAQQPLRTSAGYLWRNGAPTRAWAQSDCSLLVLDSALRQVLYAPSGATRSASGTRFLQAGTGAVERDAQDKEREVFSVKDFGAVGDGATNDQAAIQAAIDAAFAAGGGTVYFPPGTYKVVAKQRTSDPSNNHAYDGHPIVIPGSNVVLRGAGRENTTIQLRNYGDTSMVTNWQVVAAKVFRGAGVFIKGGASLGAKVQNVGIYDLALDGGAGYTGLNTFPANTGTGDGWDLTHKGVWLENDRYHENIAVVNCDVRTFRGELVYQGGPNGGRLWVLNNLLHDSNGDGVSSSAGNVVRWNKIYTLATAGIECAFDGPSKWYEDNEIYSCDKEGISLSSYGAPTTPANTVSRNTVRNCTTGILLFGAVNTRVFDNTLVDCGPTPAGRALLMTSTAAFPVRDTEVFDNKIVVDGRNTNLGVALSGSGVDAPVNLQVYDNVVQRTRAAVAAGFTCTEGFTFSTDAGFPAFISYGNRSDSTFKFTTQDTCEETLLTTAAATVVARRRPDKNRNFLVGGYVEVFTALTNVTLVVKWRNSAGTEFTQALQPLFGLAVGCYSYAPILIHAYGDSEVEYIKVEATAGTANQVRVSASILQAPFQ